MASPTCDARVSKKQKKGQQSTPNKHVLSAPIGSGRTGYLTSLHMEPTPISPHFQAQRLVATLLGKEPQSQLLAAPPAPSSSVPCHQ